MAVAGSALTQMVEGLSRRSALSPPLRTALLSLPNHLVAAKRDDTLFKEGRSYDHCAILLSGFAYSHRLTRCGHRQITAIHLPGDVLNLRLAASGRASTDIQALTELRAAHIPLSAIEQLADTASPIALALWAATQAEISILAEWLLNLGRRDARGRVAHFLCEFAYRQEAAHVAGAPRYSWPLRQEQVADICGLTAVHVNRTLRKLRSEGLVRVGQQSLIIHEPERLRAMAEFSPDYLQLVTEADARATRVPEKETVRQAQVRGSAGVPSAAAH